MTDPHALFQALASVKAATDITRGLLSASGAMEKADLKLRIAELAGTLADAHLSIASAQEENVALRARITELEEEKRTRAALKPHNAAYWLTLEGGGEDGPFCTACYDTKGLAVRMVDRGTGYTCCPAPGCNHCITSPNQARGQHRRLRYIRDAEDLEDDEGPPY